MIYLMIMAWAIPGTIIWVAINKWEAEQETMTDKREGKR